MKNKAISNIQIDNKLVKVTKYSFMPGQETGMHKHLYDYIVTPITDGKLLLIDKCGNESNYNLISCQILKLEFFYISERKMQGQWLLFLDFLRHIFLKSYHNNLFRIPIGF